MAHENAKAGCLFLLACILDMHLLIFSALIIAGEVPDVVLRCCPFTCLVIATLSFVLLCVECALLAGSSKAHYVVMTMLVLWGIGLIIMLPTFGVGWRDRAAWEMYDWAKIDKVTWEMNNPKPEQPPQRLMLERKGFGTSVAVAGMSVAQLTKIKKDRNLVWLARQPLAYLGCVVPSVLMLLTLLGLFQVHKRLIRLKKTKKTTYIPTWA